METECLRIIKCRKCRKVDTDRMHKHWLKEENSPPDAITWKGQGYVEYCGLCNIRTDHLLRLMPVGILAVDDT